MSVCLCLSLSVCLSAFVSAFVSVRSRFVTGFTATPREAVSPPGFLSTEATKPDGGDGQFQFAFGSGMENAPAFAAGDFGGSVSGGAALAGSVICDEWTELFEWLFLFSPLLSVFAALAGGDDDDEEAGQSKASKRRAAAMEQIKAESAKQRSEKLSQVSSPLVFSLPRTAPSVASLASHSF
jgi:hypothetical protein